MSSVNVVMKHTKQNGSWTPRGGSIREVIKEAKEMPVTDVVALTTLQRIKTVLLKEKTCVINMTILLVKVK